MNTRRNAARKLVVDIADAGAPPHYDQVPPLHKNANVGQAPANPPTMIEAEMRAIHAQTVQSMTAQAQVVMVQEQAMTT